MLEVYSGTLILDCRQSPVFTEPDYWQNHFLYTCSKTKDGSFGNINSHMMNTMIVIYVREADALTYSAANRSGYKEHKSYGKRCVGCT